jgi:hypothetical protein
MTPSQSTLAAIAIALPVLGFGVAPKIFATEPPPTEMCEPKAPEMGALNGEPAIIYRVCNSPFLLVTPGGQAPPPVAIPTETDDVP